MLGEILGAVGSIAGGLLNNKSQKKAAEQNYQQQKEFAQNSLSWKAADAERAGISKVFAMGAPTTSFAPSSVGSNFDFLGQAGQNVGRAISATQSPAGQTTALQKAGGAIALEGAQLDNDIKRAQLASITATNNQAGQPPGPQTMADVYKLPGQAPTVDAPNLKPQSKIEAADPRFPANTAGVSPSVAYQRNNTGGYSPYIPNTMAESYESDHMGGAEWSIRNRLFAPMMGSQYGPKPEGRLPPWQTMYFNPTLWQWEVRDRSDFPNRDFGRFNTRKR